jgi:FkbM family methyltransferase
MRLTHVLNKVAQHTKERTVMRRVRWEVSKRITQLQNLKEYRKREKWHKAQRTTGNFVVRINRGAKLRLFTDSVLCKFIHFHNFESAERSFVCNYLQEGDIFADIGANIGLFTVIAARSVGETGLVYAFEPAERPYQRLLQNVHLNKIQNVHAIRLGISDKVGQEEFSVPDPEYDAWASLGTPSAGAIVSKKQIGVTTLDSFVRESNLTGRVALIKMDIEGWECKALLGGRDILSGPHAPVLQVEFSDENAKNSGVSCSQLYAMLEGQGYTVCRYCEKENIVVPDPMRESYPFMNLVATKNITATNSLLGGTKWKSKVLNGLKARFRYTLKPV